MEGKLVHIHCNSLFPWPPKSRDVTAQKLSRGEKKQRLDRLLRETAKIMICRIIPVKVMHRIKIWPAFSFSCALSAQTSAGHPEQHRVGKVYWRPEAEWHGHTFSWICDLWDILEATPAGASSTITGAVWKCLGGSRPLYLTHSFNTARYHLTATFSTCHASAQHQKSQLRHTLYNQKAKAHFLSCPTCAHTYQLDMEIFCELFFPGYFSAASKCHSITQSGCTRIQSWPYYNLI